MKFKRRPQTPIEAMQFVFTMQGVAALRNFCNGQLGNVTCGDGLAEAVIGTLEDGAEGQIQHIATEGDWIAKGGRGEFYPIKEAIFPTLYEAVKPDAWYKNLFNLVKFRCWPLFG